MDRKVVIYTTPTCVYCRAAKEFFKENNVAYDEFDVASDADKREEMIQKSGQMGVPVIFVNNKMVIGFNKEKLSELFGIV